MKAHDAILAWCRDSKNNLKGSVMGMRENEAAHPGNRCRVVDLSYFQPKAGSGLVCAAATWDEVATLMGIAFDSQK